jgi:gamma-polyglutamate biosynthesis protein CapC
VIGGDLSPEAAALGLGIGLVLALICYLTTNLSPGGMITPGWLALMLVEDWRQVGVVGVMTVVTLVLSVVLRRVTILYGKRLFAAVVLLSVLLQVSLFMVVQHDYPLLFAHQTLGFIAPGLIVYQLIRQPPARTLLVTGIVSAGTYVVLISGVLAGVVPTT